MRTFSILLLCFLGISQAFGADTTIQMLNKQGKERMVYSQKIIRVNVGETVFWQARNKGHNVEFIQKNGIPTGVEKFKTKLGKNAEYKFNIPGIYAYWCTPHKSMGMVGFVIVGDNMDNIDAIKKVKYFGKSKKIAKNLIASFK
jgi:pseudoazurin